ncbi:hypothetical protein [Shewanella sp. 10N.286.52.C2]|uniref:hypothetical protein n=1 Tax=Shewanella sp. 10N.286.52.C2 TaxID=1880838 RepID=UPI0012FFD806|nr:hypothetical protein [Shewanella sp. 10N.286.52.C2]
MAILIAKYSVASNEMPCWRRFKRDKCVGLKSSKHLSRDKKQKEKQKEKQKLLQQKRLI